MSELTDAEEFARCYKKCTIDACIKKHESGHCPEYENYQEAIHRKVWGDSLNCVEKSEGSQ